MIHCKDLELLSLYCTAGQPVTLSSSCLAQNGDFELQLTCEVENVPSLRWFFNGGSSASYSYVRGSPTEVCPCPLTDDSMLAGVEVTVTEASGGDTFSATSVLTANKQALLALNVHSVECGSASTSQSIMVNSNVRCKLAWHARTQCMHTIIICHDACAEVDYDTVVVVCVCHASALRFLTLKEHNHGSRNLSVLQLAILNSGSRIKLEC